MKLRGDAMLTQRDRRRRRLRRLLRLSVILLGIVTISVTVGLLAILPQIPSIDQLDQYRPLLMTQIYDRRGELIAEYGEERRKLASLDEIPQHVVNAVLAAEDAGFFQHEGIDIPGIARAMWANLLKGKVVQGGSTITQQVAKTLFLTPERTLIRKVKEVVLALKLEWALEKKDILFLYLNQIYFGNGAYGIGTAAQTYFSKPISEVTVAEGAILAGLPQAPSRYAPNRNPDSARSRQIYVLDQMVENAWLDKSAYQAAVNEIVKIRQPQSAVWQAPYFAEWVRQWLIARYGEDAVLRDGLQVQTTLDLRHQLEAQRAVSSGLIDLTQRQGFFGPIAKATADRIDRVAAGIKTDLTEAWRRKTLGYIAVVGPKETMDADREVSMPTDLDTIPDMFDTPISAVVVSVRPTERLAIVQFGDFKGVLPAWEMTWARKPNPAITEYEAFLDQPSAVLSRGDVIEVVPMRWKDALASPIDKRFKTSWKDVAKMYRSEAVPVRLHEPPVAQSALVSIDVATGEILAMVGGYDFRRSQYNRVIQMQRQPGSAFKPIVYASALENKYTAASVLLDTALVYEDTETGTLWRPQNYEGEFHGKTTLFDALTFSRNVVTVQLAGKLGVRPIHDMATRLGIASELPKDLSVGLGTAAITPIEMVRSYATFANAGRRPEIILIRDVRTTDGKRLYSITPPAAAEPIEPYVERPSDPSENAKRYGRHDELPVSAPTIYDAYPQMISSEVAYIMTSMLRSVVTRGTAVRARDLNWTVAGKTGTTNENFDSWFAGYAPQLAAAVWVGFDDARSLGREETGAKAALPIWIEYMHGVLQGKPDRQFDVPPNVVFRRIDTKTGKLSSPFSDKVLIIPFISGTEPEETDETEQDAAFESLDSQIWQDELR